MTVVRSCKCQPLNIVIEFNRLKAQWLMIKIQMHPMHQMHPYLEQFLPGQALGLFKYQNEAT